MDRQPQFEGLPFRLHACPNPTGSGEPQVGEAKARVATLEEQITQEEGKALPEIDPIGSPTIETVAAPENDVLSSADQTTCPTDTPTPVEAEGEDGAESRSHEPDEAGEE